MPSGLGDFVNKQSFSRKNNQSKLSKESTFMGAKRSKEKEDAFFVLFLSTALVFLFCCFCFCFFCFSHFFSFAMVKIAHRAPDPCSGSSKMDLFIPVTVVTEAQTLCDDKGNSTGPKFDANWPSNRLV